MPFPERARQHGFLNQLPLPKHSMIIFLSFSSPPIHPTTRPSLPLSADHHRLRKHKSHPYPKAPGNSAGYFCHRSPKWLGPNGMTTQFYQKCWWIVAGDVVAVVQSFFQGNHLLKTHNHTHIALIPKWGNTATVYSYLPISLFFYKIIQKFWQPGWNIFFSENYLSFSNSFCLR